MLVASFLYHDDKILFPSNKVKACFPGLKNAFCLTTIVIISIDTRSNVNILKNYYSNHAGHVDQTIY